MRIGIDIDDTIVKTNEKIKEVILRENYDMPSFYFRDWDMEMRRWFFGRHFIEIVNNVELYKGAKEGVKKLKSLGHEIWLITSRSNFFTEGVIEQTHKFLEKEDIVVDKIFLDKSHKASFCLENKVDLLIDDHPTHCTQTLDEGINVIVMDRFYNKGVNAKRAYNWEDVVKIIENMEA